MRRAAGVRLGDEDEGSRRGLGGRRAPFILSAHWPGRLRKTLPRGFPQSFFVVHSHWPSRFWRVLAPYPEFWPGEGKFVVHKTWRNITGEFRDLPTIIFTYPCFSVFLDYKQHPYCFRDSTLCTSLTREASLTPNILGGTRAAGRCTTIEIREQSARMLHNGPSSLDLSATAHPKAQRPYLANWLLPKKSQQFDAARSGGQCVAPVNSPFFALHSPSIALGRVSLQVGVKASQENAQSEASDHWFSLPHRTFSGVGLRAYTSLSSDVRSGLSVARQPYTLFQIYDSDVSSPSLSPLLSLVFVGDA